VDHMRTFLNLIKVCSVGFIVLWGSLGSKAQLASEKLDPHVAAAEVSKLGHVDFLTSCAPAVEQSFNNAVALLHSFEFEEAIAGFQAIERQDLSCSMAAWGIAISRLARRGADAPKDVLQRGWTELQPALLHPATTPREQEYLDAIAVRYRRFETDSSSVRGDRYRAAMKKLHEDYPLDEEASLFYGLALFGDSKQALAVLLPVFAADPNSPGAAHYIIHAADSAELAYIALPAARKYASIAPDSPHALHMPSHIFCRLGLWQESIKSNQDSATVAHQWVIQRRAGGTFDEEHARNTMMYAFLQSGQSTAAKEQIRSVADLESLSFAHADPWMSVDDQIVYDLELHDWKHALVIEPPSSSKFSDNFEVYWLRAIALAHLNESADAQKAYDRFLQSSGSFANRAVGFVATLIKVETLQARAALEHAQHNDAEAIATLTEATTFEKANFIYYPDVIPRPSAEILGDLLLELHRDKEAGTAYRQALIMTPNRFDSVYGAFKAAQASNDEQSEREFAIQLGSISQVKPDRSEVSEAAHWLREHSTVSTAGQAYLPLPSGQELVQVHGHQLFLNCEGPAFGPTVVLMAGGGGNTSNVWDKVQPQVATFARVCSYDRAGLGKSGAINKPQSAEDIADDLAVLLETAHVPLPYILVGHSIGGLYVRKYDEQHDSRVAAMVLVDSSHEEQIWRFAKSEPEALSEYPEWKNIAAMSAQGFLPPNQHLSWHFTKPLIVLEKSIPPEPVWNEMQEDLATRSPLGRLVLVPHSRHYIQKDNPELVIQSVRTALDQSTTTQPHSDQPSGLPSR